MGEKKPLTLQQVKSIIDKGDKSEAEKRQRKNSAEQIVNGKKAIYCAALRKKVNITPGSAKIYAIKIGKGRSAIFLEGSSPKCVTKEGKKTSARTILANIPNADISGRSSGSPKRSKSGSKKRKKSPKKRSRSKSPKKRKRSKSR